MKNFVYKLQQELVFDIPKNDKTLINNASSVLIQLFSGEEKEIITSLLHFLSETFPHAIIITATTDGEIFQTEVTQYSTVISISTFDETTLQIAHTNENNSYKGGKTLAKELIKEDTKLLIAFTNGILCNGEEFLNGISTVDPDIVVAGGLAGDNAKFQTCYIGKGVELFDHGAVGVALHSKTLCVQTLYNFGWQPIGLQHTITKSDKNRVYTIDDISAVDFYRKYLGEEVTQKLPMTGIEFPLIIKKGDLNIARAVITRHEDDSLSFAGNIEEGEDVYIGIGEKETILANHINTTDSINVEAFFIYSCMARRRFIQDLVSQELEPFAALAPTSGFFTYGEFYTDNHHKKAELLNQTLTAVALSEVQKCDLLIKPSQKHEDTEKHNTTFEALMHILEITSKELQEQTKIQEKINAELSAKTRTLELIQEMSNLGSWELDLQSMQIQWSNASYKIYNKDQQKGPPTYQEFFDMVLPKDRDKLLKVHNALDDGELHSIEIRVKRDDGKIITVLESGKMLFDENNRPFKIVGTTFDITELRLKETMLMQQARSAQMGEMVNMIAHQWRQPLNAISSASIKLKLQNDMNILTPQELTKTACFIEDMTQKMSQTINDFMNFTKPSKDEELVDFEIMLDEILKIMGPQLTNHNILLRSHIEKDFRFTTYKKELEHVIINIIANARDVLEHSHISTKYIDIEIYKQELQCIIKIQDNAGGINEDIIDRIFDPYYTTKEAGKGTGLGLYMSKKILQEHLNGDIFVSNTTNGAEFTIILEQTDD